MGSEYSSMEARVPVSVSNEPDRNILENHNFSNHLQPWYANCCDAFVVSPSSVCKQHVVVTNRNQHWQGLEQDITAKVTLGSTYTVFARVGVSGARLKGVAHVIASLRFEYKNSCTKYLNVARKTVAKEKWENMIGTFVLADKPDRVVLYLQGPGGGVNILILSVFLWCHGKNGYTEDGNIILNPEFEKGVSGWSGRGCKIAVHDSMGDGKILPKSGKFFAATSERAQNWNGIQRDITGKVQRKIAYEVSAFVRIFGNKVTSSNVQATLWVKTPGSREQYIGISAVQATDSDWVQLQGKFLLKGLQSKVVIFFEGPPSGTDILLNGCMIRHVEKLPPSPSPVIQNPAYGVNIIRNSNLSDGTNSFFPLGSCTLNIVTGSPRVLPTAARDTLGPHEPLSGKCIHVTNRTQTWMGLAQMITEKIKLYVTYQVSAWVRLSPGTTVAGPQIVSVALGVDSHWVNGGQVEINDSNMWHEICGSFRIEKKPEKVMVNIHGPAAGLSFMVAGLQIFAVDRQARFRHLNRQIDKIRKRDVTLKFPELSSTPGTMVIIKQSQNSFPIGSCISRLNIDNEDFVTFFVKNFNWAVFGKELKWYINESQRGNLNYKDVDELLKFCDDNNIAARGHCIFSDVDNTVQDLATAVQNRLKSLLGRYKGKFKHYDVINEMLHGSFYPNLLGHETLADKFKTANELDPSATLFVNDHHGQNGCDPRLSPEKYISQILDLQQKGAPVGGIGIKGHIESPVGPTVCSALDKLGTLGLPIWLTELDVSSSNEHIRADDLEVMFREAFAHPAVEGIMIWGFWELFMSRKNTHLVNINEVGNRFLELKKEWLSYAHGRVDDQGEFKFRGFPGTYELIVVANNKTTFKKFTVEKGHTPVIVAVDT